MKDVRTLSGGMKLDDNPLVMKPEDYSYARNFRNNNKNDGGKSGNMIDFTQLSTRLSNDKIVGAVYSVEHNVTILFVYNTNENYHRIITLDDVTDMTNSRVVYKGVCLNFSANKILNPKVYAGYVIWTDDNGIRIVDIQRGLNTNDTSYVGDYIYRKQNSSYNIDFVARPPLSAPVANYDTDLDYKQDNLKGKQFKFAYKYEYMDGRVSVWSPWSIVPNPLGEEIQGGDEPPDEILRNVINITLNIDYGYIKKVYIGMLENNAVTAKIIDVLDVYDANGDYIIYRGGKLINTFTYYSFYNNEIYVSETLSDFYKSYHTIPEKAESFNIIEDGRVVLANSTDGFDIPVVDVDVEVLSETVDVVYNIPTVNTVSATDTVNLSYSGLDSVHKHYKFATGYLINGLTHLTGSYSKNDNGAVSTGSIDIYDYYTHNPSLSTADNFAAMISGLSGKIRSKLLRGFRSFESSSDDRCNFDEVLYPTYDNADNFLLISFPSSECYTSLTTGVSGMDSKIYILSSAELSSTKSVSITISSFTYTDNIYPKFKSLKSNSLYDLAIVYYKDSGVNSGAIKIGRVKTVGLSYGTVSATEQNYLKQYFRASINHLPPFNATHYRFAVAENSAVSDYIQLHTKTTILTSSGSVIELDQAVVIQDMINANKKVILQPWVYEDGDRVRLFARYDGVRDYGFVEQFDVPIIGYDPTNGKIKFKNNSSLTTIVAGSLFEIYRPKKGVDADYNVYREIGDKYNIIGGYHTGSTQTQTSSVPAISDINFGDTWIRERYADSTNIYPVESKYYSDYYVSDFSDLGRPVFYLPDMKYDVKSSEFRHGGKLLPDSNINNIANFESSGIHVIPDDYGTIRAVVSKGDTMLLIQDKKITSYYVGKDVITKADGSSELIAQSNVVGNSRRSDYDYGTMHESSVVRVNTHIYFFDAVNGCFVRHAENGSFPISDYGVNSFAKLVSEKYLDCTDYNRFFYIGGAYTSYSNEIWWAVVYDDSIEDPQDLKYEIVSFNVMDNTWKTFVDAAERPDLICNTRDLIVHTKADKIYLESKTGDDYLPLTLEVISNQEPLQNKVFNYVAIESNLEMNNSSYDAVQVDGGLMKTNIPLLKKKENIWYADFRRDSLTPMSGSTIDKVRNGRRLRGKYLSLNVSNDSTSKVEIDSIIIDSTISNRL